MSVKWASVRVGSVVAVLLVAAACSSSGTKSPSGGSVKPSAGLAATSSSAAKPLGSKVKIGLIGSIKTAGLDVSPSVASAQAAARSINAAGGLQGHEVVIDTCNDQFSAAGATACGRQMITDKVIAVTGSSVFDVAFQPQLADAGIPIVGFAVTSLAGYTGSNEYLTTAGSLFEIYAAVYYAATHGSKKIYVSRADVAVTAAVTATVKAAAAKVGYSAVGEQAIPATATDLSNYAQQFKSSGADTAALAYPSPTAVKFATTANSLGLTSQKFAYTAANLSKSDVAQLGSAASQFVIGSALPPLNATTVPGIKQFLSEMKAEETSGDSDAALDQQSNTSLQSWLAVTAIGKVLTGSGDPDATSMTSALKTAKDIDLGGVIPPWTPDKPGAAPFVRVSNPSMFIEEIVNGNLTLDSTQEFDVRAAMGI